MIRFDALHSLIQPGLPLWDIGRDHGILGVRALAENLVPVAHFIDESKAVTDRLAMQLRNENPARYRIWHLKGEKLPWDEIEGSVVIAGVGNPTIRSVVSAISVRNRERIRLIVSTEKNSDELRVYLKESGWRLVPQSERVCRERSRFRLVFAAEYGKGEELNAFGNEIFTGQMGREYLNHLLQLWRSSKINVTKWPERFEDLLALETLHGGTQCSRSTDPR